VDWLNSRCIDKARKQQHNPSGDGDGDGPDDGDDDDIGNKHFLSSKGKAERGISNNVTGYLLCPIDYEWKDPT